MSSKQFSQRAGPGQGVGTGALRQRCPEVATRSPNTQRGSHGATAHPGPHRRGSRSEHRVQGHQIYTGISPFMAVVQRGRHLAMVMPGGGCAC